MEYLAYAGVFSLYVFMWWIWPAAWATSEVDDAWWHGVLFVHVITIVFGGGLWGIIYLINK